MTVSFQKLGPAGAQLLSELQKASFMDAGEQLWPAGDMATLLCGPHVLAMTISQAGQVVGYILWRYAADEAEILSIGILPECRGRGMASLLISEVFDQAEKLDIREIFLEVRADNKAAIGLYHKCGFEAVGRRKDYYGNVGGSKQDALVLKYPGK
ncbi:Ribosomal-protein-S18p-alanine acetyltransferase [hydrothermal vent metagenome]|uniref:Ribosomal-protein-S18p-alanine acetyltransferase n=1 Tax=hydrothermal vent metagenome TaxID=652676 RepID=A0A3B0R5A6_9ZZZZ